MAVANTLAYYDTAATSVLKKYIVQASGANASKLESVPGKFFRIV
jgi:hypothetical protein